MQKMNNSVMSAGDFARVCETWHDRFFYYSSSDQKPEGHLDMRVRFTSVAATVCPNKVVFQNDCGDSLTVRGIKRVRVEYNVSGGIDRITLVSGSDPERMCILLTIKNPKTH